MRPWLSVFLALLFGAPTTFAAERACQIINGAGTATTGASPYAPAAYPKDIKWQGRGWFVVQWRPPHEVQFVGGPYRSAEVCETAELNLESIDQGGQCDFFGKHKFIIPIPGEPTADGNQPQ